MRKLLRSSTLAVSALAAALLTWQSGPSQAQGRTQDQLRQIAAKLAAELALACPHVPAPARDTTAFQTCVTTLSQSTDFPLANTVLWGGDQADKPIKNRHLTRFSADVFRSTYMPFLTFTGRYTIDRDDKEKLDIIRLEAYFRNELPAGEYPYPFWHASAKWDAYENMNRLSLYINDAGNISVVTRGAAGSDANRGQYTRVTRPPFEKDQWTWTDMHGQQQPRIMLFSSRYQAANPHLVKLDETYRTFAMTMREGACVACHSPNNSPGARQLILLQTPIHAMGEIERVIKTVRGESMPLDDVGLPKDMDPAKRAAILQTAEAFRDTIVLANKWEASRRQATSGTDLPAQPTR